MNKVYIIVVNYNGYSDTVECVESLLKSTYQDFQVFIVDNSSHISKNYFSGWLSSNTLVGIKTDFEDLVLPLQHKPLGHLVITEEEFIQSDKPFKDKVTIVTAVNRGFAAANNIILNYILKEGSAGSMVWMLNNDTVVKKDTLSHLVEFYNSSDAEKYILGSKLMYYHSPSIIQAVAGEYNKWIGKHTHVGGGQEDHGQFDHYQPRKMSYIVGASMFFTKSFIKDVGLLSEAYFLYFEELDWMQRAIRCGYNMAVVPKSIVYHKEGASIINKDNKEHATSTAEYYSIINRVRFIKKWYPNCLFTVMAGVTWALTKRMLKGRFAFVKNTGVAVFKILFST